MRAGCLHQASGSMLKKSSRRKLSKNNTMPVTENHAAINDANITSASDAIWWGFATITTVGYGDISPQTALGQALASVIMVLGYGIIAVPTGIVSAEVATARGREELVANFVNGAHPDIVLADYHLDDGDTEVQLLAELMPQAEVLTGREATIDNVTGLMWQKSPAAKMTLDEARSGAANLGLAVRTGVVVLSVRPGPCFS